MRTMIRWPDPQMLIKWPDGQMIKSWPDTWASETNRPRKTWT